MEARAKLWLERDGQLTISAYRAELLRRIDETGSLARAAAGMHLSYRRAWGKVRELEQHLQCSLVHSDTGGAGGGRSVLTAEGRTLLLRWDAFAAAHAQLLAELTQQYFAAPLAASGEAGEHRQPIADDSIYSPARQLGG